jgi:hypothetical protein
MAPRDCRRFLKRTALVATVPLGDGRARAYYGLGDLQSARLMQDEAGLLRESMVPLGGL